MKFSAFARKSRDYSIDEKAEMRKRMKPVDEPFEPKAEFTQIKFDENIRHRMDNIDTKLTYRALVYKEPDYDP